MARAETAIAVNFNEHAGSQNAKIRTPWPNTPAMNRNPATQAANPDTFANLGAFDCIIDVRSPGEFAEDHLPGAINCPVLDDEQRITIGTRYKQVSPFEARKLGAAMVSENIARHLREHFLAMPKHWKPLIYCWRGGQRSGAMTTVFRQIGWDAKQLDGGYKAYRRFVVDTLAELPRTFSYRIIKGATGSAKTRILQAMARQGAQVIDLEALAGHKGSVLGLVPDTAQPSQKSFEAALLFRLQNLEPERPVFVEAESRKIGVLHVPEAMIESMRASHGITIDAPRSARVEYLLRDYDYFITQIETLLLRLAPLKQIRGEPTIEKWRKLALSGHWTEFVDALLTDHYDALYQKSQATNYSGPESGENLIEAVSLDDASIERLAVAAIAVTNEGITSSLINRVNAA